MIWGSYSTHASQLGTSRRREPRLNRRGRKQGACSSEQVGPCVADAGFVGLLKEEERPDRDGSLREIIQYESGTRSVHTTCLMQEVRVS